MKKKVVCLLFRLVLRFSLVGCGRENDKVSYNLSKQADNFNVFRLPL